MTEKACFSHEKRCRNGCRKDKQGHKSKLYKDSDRLWFYIWLSAVRCFLWHDILYPRKSYGMAQR